MEDHHALLRAEWGADEPSPRLRRQLILRASLCRRLARDHEKLRLIMSNERVPETVGERAFHAVWRAHHVSPEEFSHAWEALAVALRASTAAHPTPNIETGSRSV